MTTAEVRIVVEALIARHAPEQLPLHLFQGVHSVKIVPHLATMHERITEKLALYLLQPLEWVHAWMSDAAKRTDTDIDAPRTFYMPLSSIFVFSLIPIEKLLILLLLLIDVLSATVEILGKVCLLILRFFVHVEEVQSIVKINKV